MTKAVAKATAKATAKTAHPKFSAELEKKIIDFVEKNGVGPGAGFATAQKVAKSCHISRATLYRWLTEKPDFKEKYEAANDWFRAHAVANLQKSLYDLAAGGTFTTTEQFYSVNEEGEKILVKEKVSKKEQPGNVAAAIFLLGKYSPDFFSNDYEPAQQNNNTVIFEVMKGIAKSVHKNSVPEKTTTITNVDGNAIEPVEGAIRQ